ncbi:FLUCTUATING-LIGHT-ACCLIMATION protein 1, chloroplastic-like [Apium graveolens]|uniref:FLUCTUATING-LIGHT-ACCLIMATION protein 1, chloroplastic-like n=1 Tax=Apium graveolens TaxID=4045 RepID=UPI003D7A3CDD
MNTPFLLESNLKWNPSLQTFPIHYSSFKPTNHFIKHSLKFTQTPKFHIKCSSFNDIPTRAVLKSSNKQNPVQILTETIIKTLKSLQKPAITAVLLGILLLSDLNNVLAASGGRMGGKSFSRPSMSSSRSYSTPRIDSGRSFSSAPYFGPSPFGGGGFYVGPAVGIGSSFFFIMAGFAAFVLVSGFLSDRSDDGLLTATEKTSVLKLQVGLLGMARSLQQDLNRIAERADTSTPVGLSYVLTETMLALLRHPDFCISAFSSVDVKRSMDEGEKRFNQLSIEERGKFDEETLVNVNNIKKQSATSRRANGFRNEYIVITILVAAEGVHKLPSINNSGDLKQALQVLASIPSSRTLAVEVLWTPQNEDDTLSERELLEDYSLLRPL